MWVNGVVFSRFSRHFVPSSQKMRKNSVFWAFLRDFLQKVSEIRVFFSRFFKALCTKFAKNAEKLRFLSFLRDVHQKVWENSLLSRFSRHFVQSSQKMLKTAFFEIILFAQCPAKSVRKQCFFTFFETLSTKFTKNAKKQRFLSFLHRCSAKSVRKQCYVSFSRHFLQS